MNVYFSKSARKAKPRRSLIFTAAFLFLCLFLTLFTSCQRSEDYFSYLSEHRSNLFLVEMEEFSVRIYALEKEHPFVADGMVGEKTKRAEIYLVANGGTENCQITFHANGNTYGGEASYDSVKREYFYSCAVDLSQATSVPLSVELGEGKYEVTAHSVKTTKTLSGQQILNALTEKEAELFRSLTDKNGFSAEIHLRLLYEEAPYYYMGVVDKTGKITAFLLDATTGNILAKRES